MVVGLLRESLQIQDHLFDLIEFKVCQAYGFLNKPNVNKRCPPGSKNPFFLISQKRLIKFGTRVLSSN